MSPEKNQTSAELEERIQFETLIADLSSKFVNLPAGELDSEIMEAERRICELLGIDFSALWQVSAEDPGYFTVTHVYSVQRGSQQSLERMKVEDFPWFLREMLAGRIVIIPSLKEMPAEAAHDRESCRKLGIKSNLCLPLSVGGQSPFGIFGLNTTQAERDWPDALVKRLQLVAQVFTNALARKRAEQVLRDNAERYQTIISTTTDGFWELDGQGRVVATNDEGSRLYGYGRDEFLTKSLPDIEANKNPAETRAHIERMRATGYDRFESRHCCKDGRIIDVEVSTTYRPSSGTFLAFVRDITARKRAEAELRESEEINRATFDQAAVGIAHVGTDGRWLAVNDKLCAIVGYPREELLQLTFQDITHPDDLESDLDYMDQVLHGKIKTYSIEKRYFRKDRSLVWVNLAVSLVRNTAGEPRHFIAVVKDVTDRKRAEDSLRTSERSLAAGIVLAGLGYYEIDYAESSSFADDRFGEICAISPGQQPDHQRMQFWIEHLHPDDRERVLENRQKMYDGNGEGYDVEYRYLHPTQGEKWIHHMAYVATRDATGRGTRICGVVCDITERKRLSERLESAAEEWKTTFDSINDMVMILDPEFHIVQANAATARFLSLPMERIVGSACFTLMHGTMCPISECPCHETYQANQHSELELFHAGSGRWLLFSTDPIQDAAGKVIGAVHVGRDVSESKRVEAELLRQRTELAHIARVSTMGELAASMAHELNQPLGAILANAETAEILLKQEPPALDDMPAILAAIRRDNERASEVIRRMRSMFRKRELEHQPLEINSLVQDVLRLIGGDAALRGVSIAADLAPALPQVCADRVHLQQVLVNLIINGMDAMASQPRGRRRISVHTRLGAGSQVELAVVDSGSGIEPDKLPRLFEPFYTTKADGMGMGLSIARTIVEVHGGRLWAENNSSGGAVFRILLPAGGKMQVAEAGSVRSAPPSTKAIAR